MPPQAADSLTPITGAIDNLIRESATKIVRSEQFYTVWVQMNRYGHKAFIAAISDKTTGVIQKQGGTVTLETTVLVDQIKTGAVEQGPGLRQQHQHPDQEPADRAGRLGRSRAARQSRFRSMNTMAYLLPFLALAMLAGGVALAVDRRKAVLWVGIGITASVLLPLEAIYFAQAPFVACGRTSSAECPRLRRQAAYTLVFRNLVAAQQLFTVVGLVFVVGAMLAGPEPVRDLAAQRLQARYGEHRPGLGLRPRRRVDLRAPERHAHGRHHRRDRDSADRTGRGRIATIVWLVVGVVVWIALVALFGRPRPMKAVLEEARTRRGAGGRVGRGCACGALPLRAQVAILAVALLGELGVPAPSRTRRVVREA